jgi:hypothetical protein
VTASNLDNKESPVAPPTRRRAGRRLKAVGLVIVLAAGLIALRVVSARDGRAPAGSSGSSGGSGSLAGSSVGLPASAGTTLVPKAALGQVATALDEQFAAYSNRSTCADWAGGDGLSAVRLSASQIAWFFADSFLGPAGSTTGFSHTSGIVHNTVVIQTLSGQRSGFVTLTGGGVCRAKGWPTSVVGPPQAPGPKNARYWGEDGLSLGATIVKFYNSYRPGNAPYIPTGTVIATFPAAQLSSAGAGTVVGGTVPGGTASGGVASGGVASGGVASGGVVSGGVVTPRLTALPSYTPPGAISPIEWGAAVLRIGDTVYVYGTQTPDTPVPDRQLYVARVPASRLTQFAAWQFYAGSGQWTASQPAAQPVEPPDSSLSVSSGFSVVQAGSRYWLIQANPIAGNQDIDAYPADTPWGPFEQAAGIVVYRDPSIGIDAAHDYRILYEARVVPASPTGDALVVGYNVNSIASTAGCVPMSWFTDSVTLPRFISVPLTAFGSRGDGREDVVTTGPSDYPRIASRDPSQWFNEWNYPDGCPPVPGVTGVRAQPRPGAVTLSWPSAGLGVAYRVYIQRPNAAGGVGGTAGGTVAGTAGGSAVGPPFGTVASTLVGYVLSATRSVTVTLPGLAPGRYVAQVVPVNLIQHTGHTGQVAFTVP